jgi:hypothetical protein
MSLSRSQLVGGLGTVAVGASIVAGIFTLGSPAEERTRRLDEGRVQDLTGLARSLDPFWTRHSNLPGSLDELRKEPGVRAPEDSVMARTSLLLKPSPCERRLTTGADTMHVTRALIAAAFALAVCGGDAAAQDRADFGLLFGWTKTGSEGTTLAFHLGNTYEATIAWRVWRLAAADVAVELPFVAIPSFTTKTPGALLPKEHAALFLTPGARVTFMPKGFISVFGAVGGGYARYSESVLRADGGPNPAQLDTNAGAVAFGGGVTVRGGGWVNLRGELRDIYTGARRFSVAPPGDRVHNVVVSLGISVPF